MRVKFHKHWIAACIEKSIVAREFKSIFFITAKIKSDLNEDFFLSPRSHTPFYLDTSKRFDISRIEKHANTIPESNHLFRNTSCVYQKHGTALIFW